MAAFVADVSEVHRIESVRRDFVANVSHELKTPIGALEVLAETLAEEDDPAVTRPLAERIVKEAERLARIVDDLLDLSLIETQEAPRRTPVPLEVLVDDAVEQLRPTAVAAGINLQLHPGVTGALVACDDRQVVSAIANLIDNAVKYSEPGNPVTVSTALVGDVVEVAVRDAGIGIPSRDLERIFERFYRVDQARSRATGGTGLGLAIVRHVARAHGGDITVESVEGQGSTFRLVLPLEPATSSSRRCPSDAARRPTLMAEAPLILVVDDEQSYRDALRVALEREGFRVEVAADGAEAIARFDARPPRPRAARRDAARASPASTSVGSSASRSQVPIIMVTARNAEIDAVVGLEVGADDYVTKPFRLRELVARVRAALRRGRGEDAGVAQPGEVLEIGDVRLDAARHEVAVRGERVALPLKEFELLELLLANAGRVLTRDVLIDRVWGPNYYGDTKTLDVHVKRLAGQGRGRPGQARAHRDRAGCRLPLREGLSSADRNVERAEQLADAATDLVSDGAHCFDAHASRDPRAPSPRSACPGTTGRRRRSPS